MEAIEGWFSHTLTAIGALLVGAGGLWLKLRKQNTSDWQSVVNGSLALNEANRQQVQSLREENHSLRAIISTHSNLIAALQLQRADCMARLGVLEEKFAELTGRDGRGPVNRSLPSVQ